MVRLFNPRTGALEPLPDGAGAEDRPISIYVCGITPYDTTHLGHAFTYASADILIRYLEYAGLHARYVQNVTDIDDDILKRAAEVGESWIALGNRWTRHFIEDMVALNVVPPDHYPRATEVIEEIITTVTQLIEHGNAYESDGSVYYSVDAFPGFGSLSGLDRESMLSTANERGNRPDDPNKRDPLDFVLWQAAAPGEPVWESPWGPGRPGWHIECSTMATKYLGETIDIHGGGHDLLFPHHCCEIAQIEPLTGRPFARFWTHAAMVRHDGEKMSKSLGNLVWARDLLERYSADALRVYLASHHYRIEWSHDPGRLAWAAGVAARIRSAAVATGGEGEPFDGERGEQAYRAALEADLDTPRAIAALDELAVQVLVCAAGGSDIEPAQARLRRMSAVLGMTLDDEGPESRVRTGWKEHLLKFQAV